MPVQVDDELEKYAVKKPPSDDELEQYAAKPSAPANRNDLEDYLNQPINYGTSGNVTHEELPGATPRLKEATGGKATKPVTRFEKEHTPEDTGWLARLKQYGGDVGKMVTGMAGSFLNSPAPTPGQVSDIASGYASRVIPNVGQEGMAARSPAYAALATAAQGAGIDPTGMEASAEHGDPMGVLTHAAAQATPLAAAELSRIPAVQKAAGSAVRAIGEGIPSKGDIALKFRQTEGPNEGKLGPGTEATARLAGAGAGHLLNYAGIPLVGELGGYAVGPKIADALIPKLPFDRPLKTPIGATLPLAEDFYEQKAADLAARGKEQGKLDVANEKKLTETEKARQKELADQEKLKEQDAQARQRRGVEQERLDREAAEKAALNPLAGLQSTAAPVGSATLPIVGEGGTSTAIPKVEVPGVTAPLGPKPKVESSKIIKPTEGEPVREGNEGRAATWTNEKVLDEAGKGNRVGITQAILRGLPLPENARYVMGDPDTARAVLNPREITRFTPEGVPIRNKDNPLTVSSPLIPTIQRTPRTMPPPEPAAPTGPTPGVLQFPGPLPESAPLAPAKAVGETPQTAAQPVPKAEAPTLLEPVRPLGIKPLENAKPIMEAEEEATPTEIKGITEPTTAKTGKAKPTPIEKRFTSEQIADAEGMLRAEAEAMQAAGVKSHGRQFVEDAMGEGTTAGGRNAKEGERMGGRWMTVGGGRDMYPFLRENPKVNPGDILKALRNKDSAAYRNLVEKAVDFNRRNAPPAEEAYDFVRGLGANPDAELEGIQQDIGGAEPTFNPEEIEAEAKPKEAQPTEALGLIQALKEAKEAREGILPGMGEHVAKQNEGAAKVAGENLTAEANKPKDISAAAGRMETMSPLFRGTEASPQKEIFGNAPAATPTAPDLDAQLKQAGNNLVEASKQHKAGTMSDADYMKARKAHDDLLKQWEAARGEAPPTGKALEKFLAPNAPPAAIQQAIEGTDWKFTGKNDLGLYTIQEPGTKIRISLFERELQPEFIKRKIAEKEKQFGAPEKGKKQGEVNF